MKAAALWNIIMISVLISSYPEAVQAIDLDKMMEWLPQMSKNIDTFMRMMTLLSIK